MILLQPGQPVEDDGLDVFKGVDITWADSPIIAVIMLFLVGFGFMIWKMNR